MPCSRLILVLPAVIAVACTSPAHPRLVIDDSPYVFDTVYGPPVMHHFVVRNAGDLPSGPITVELHGDTHSFTVANDGCSALAGHGQCTIDVAFGDDAAGDYRAQLTVRAGQPGVVALAEMSGRVSPASFTVEPASTPVTRGNPSPLAVTITNSGGARSGAMKLAVDGAILAFDPCSGTSLAGGGKCVFTLTVTAPLHGAILTAPTVTIRDDAGTALTTTLALTLADPAALRFAGVDFGPIDPGYAVGSVTIANPGPQTTQPLRLAIADVTTDPALDGRPLFVIDPASDHCSGVSLAPSHSCEVGIAFDRGTTVGRSCMGKLTASADNLDDAFTMITFNAIRSSVLITLTWAGNGAGRILDDGQQPCAKTSGGSCRYRVPYRSQHTFAAEAADASSTFTGWSGACSGSGPVCSLDVDTQDIALTATFVE